MRELDALLVEPVEGRGPSWHLRRDGALWQLREYVAHRSLYHLKEADPQAWVIARLDGPAKAALVSVEHDEYGAGDPDRMHARLFADMMAALGLSTAYGHYLDAVPAATLAEVNFMSLCGLHRRLRGALVGQFATVELTSSPGSDRLVRAMRRLAARSGRSRSTTSTSRPTPCTSRSSGTGVIAPLLDGEPHLADDVVFGIRGSGFLGDRFADAAARRLGARPVHPARPAARRPRPRGECPMNARPVAVVTGASRGLGFLLARELADRGHDLVVNARSESGLATAAAALQERGAAGRHRARRRRRPRAGTAARRRRHRTGSAGWTCWSPTPARSRSGPRSPCAPRTSPTRWT